MHVVGWPEGNNKGGWPWWTDHGRPAPSVEEAWQGSLPRRKGGGGCIFWTRKFHYWKRCVCVCFFIMSLFVRFQPEWNQTESNRIKPYTSLWHNMPFGLLASFFWWYIFISAWLSPSNWGNISMDRDVKTCHRSSWTAAAADKSRAGWWWSPQGWLQSQTCYKCGNLWFTNVYIFYIYIDMYIYIYTPLIYNIIYIYINI